MKIKPNASELHGDVVKIDPKDRALQNSSGNKPQTIVDAYSKEQQGDKTQISNLGAALSQQLNPQHFLDERRAKIEAIKEQIKNGTYNPPLTDVAQALAEEISSEILYAGGLGSSSEN